MMGQNDRQKEYLKEMHYRGGGIFHGASAIFPGGCSISGVYITLFSLKVKIDKFCYLKFLSNTDKISQKGKKNLKSTQMQFEYKIPVNRTMCKLHKNEK